MCKQLFKKKAEKVVSTFLLAHSNTSRIGSTEKAET